MAPDYDTQCELMVDGGDTILRALKAHTQATEPFAIDDRAALRSATEGEPLAMLIFDIDHFKAVNDSFGHLAGDTMLMKVAEIARQSLREGDIVGRIGGEEFLCILPGADMAAARICAERLRRAIAAESADAGVPAITVSLGFAGWRKGDSALALFARADAALYEAKSAGRDGVRRAALGSEDRRADSFARLEIAVRLRDVAESVGLADFGR